MADYILFWKIGLCLGIVVYKTFVERKENKTNKQTNKHTFCLDRLSKKLQNLVHYCAFPPPPPKWYQNAITGIGIKAWRG